MEPLFKGLGMGGGKDSGKRHTERENPIIFTGESLQGGLGAAAFVNVSAVLDTDNLGNRDVDTTFPENLRNPVDAQPAAVSFQDLFVALPQRVDLRLRWKPVN